MATKSGSNVITLREAARRLGKSRDKPLTPRRVKQLLADFGYQLHPLSVPGDRRIKVGARIEDIAAIKRARTLARRRVR